MGSMPTPEFVLELRQHIGHAPLWLMGATAIVFRGAAEAQEVLLVRRADTGCWAPVSGIVDPGEHPVQTVVREAMEEASVEIAVERLVWVRVAEPVTFPNSDQCQFVDHGLHAHWVAGQVSVGDEESTDVGWFPVGDLPNPRYPELDRMIALCQAGPGPVAFEV